jgi:hypothetical protein
MKKGSKNKGGAESDSGPGAQSTREVHAKNQPVNQKIFQYGVKPGCTVLGNVTAVRSHLNEI